MFEYHDKKCTTSASDEEVHTPWPQLKPVTALIMFVPS